jgi:hypothetical protein
VRCWFGALSLSLLRIAVTGAGLFAQTLVSLGDGLTRGLQGKHSTLVVIIVVESRVQVYGEATRVKEAGTVRESWVCDIFSDAWLAMRNASRRSRRR